MRIRFDTPIDVWKTLISAIACFYYSFSKVTETLDISQTRFFGTLEEISNNLNFSLITGVFNVPAPFTHTLIILFFFQIMFYFPKKNTRIKRRIKILTKYFTVFFG